MKTLLEVKIEPVVSTRKKEKRRPIEEGDDSICSTERTEAEKKEGESSASRDDSMVMEIAVKLYVNRPVPFSTDKRDHSKEIFRVAKKGDGLLHCFSIVFLQERDRYNRLIKVVDSTLNLLI
jgi:hypothetical protein